MLPAFAEGLAGVPDELVAALAEPLVDHHVHGCLDGAGRPGGEFEESLNEGSPDPIPPFMTQFDSQLGFAVRRWCAPLLGLDPARRADEYWARRAELGADERGAGAAARGRGVGRWIVDTGYGADVVTGPDTLSAWSGAPCGTVLRLESLGEELVAAGAAPADYPDALPCAPRRPRAGCRGRRSRSSPTAAGSTWTGPRRRTPPSPAEVATWAADGWRPADDVAAAGRSFGIHAAAQAGLPMQLHVGLGDRDLDLHRVDPMLLLGLLRAAGDRAGAGPAAALLSRSTGRRATSPRPSRTCAATSVWPSTTSVCGPSRSSPSRWSSRRSPGSCTPPTPAVRPSCTCSARCCGGAGWPASSAGGSARATGTLADAVRVVRMIGGENAARVYGW